MLSRLSTAFLCALLFATARVQAQAPLQPAAQLPAQLPPPAQPPPLNWDVISVKASPPEGCKPGDGGVRYLPNGLSAFCVPVVFLLEFSYQLMDPARIVGLPKWALSSQTYTIDARLSAQDAEAFNKLGREQKSGMMRSVFTERFGMKSHIETRELPAYALVTGKGGPKLKAPAQDKTSRSQFGGTDGEVEWANAPLTDLMFLLARETGRPVVDRTGLTGKYDFTLRYAPSGGGATDESNRTSIFTALEEQLGLKLVAMKQPVEVLVVDTLELPGEN